MSCCTNIKNLGCKNFCSTIETGVSAPATDTYVIEDSYTGDFFEVDITSGAEIEFTNRFNEDRITVFKIKRESTGAYILDGLNDCYQVAVKAGISLDSIAQGTPEDNCGDAHMKTFTTDGGGAYTDADFIGKTAGTDLHIYTYVVGGANTLLGTGLYTFNSGTGTLTNLIPSTKYLAFYE